MVLGLRTMPVVFRGLHAIVTPGKSFGVLIKVESNIYCPPNKTVAFGVIRSIYLDYVINLMQKFWGGAPDETEPTPRLQDVY